MAELTTEEFENKCMDLIEKIVSISPKQNRQGAIKVAEKFLAEANKTGKATLISICDRVVNEFKIATDSEYEMLRRQIFGDSGQGNK